jgi:hypothetical protein
MVEELKELPPPYEILDLGDRGTKDLVVEKWELGTMKIVPRRDRIEKRIKALRVWVTEEVKPTEPGYWDITSTTLIQGFLPHLEVPDFKLKRFRITKYGVAPAARFTLEVIPI